MNDVYLNKAPQFFYFRSRIFHREKSDKKAKPKEFHAEEKQLIWEKTLSALSELQDESGIEIYGLVLDKEGLHIVFSTPYFNENILVLDWEMRLKRDLSIEFARPILCEPVGNQEQMKDLLMEIYGSQINIESNQLQWRNPFNSLKLIFDGHRRARLFKDPLRVVFQPSLVFEIGKQCSHSSFC
jgi:hypothetical protein